MEALQSYLKQISEFPTLDREQERDLSLRAQAGDEKAMSQLIESNLDLVVRCAKKFEWRGGETLDVIAEGNSGLREAVLRYKPAKGYKFSTYAVWWIRQRINKYLCTSTRTVKVPTHVQEEGFAINRAAVKLRLELGRDPEAAELAASLSTTETRIESVKTHLQQSFTLDAPFREEDLDNIEYSTQYLLKDTYSDMPDALAEVSDLKDVITNALDCDGIDDRAKRVIIMRFGLDGDEPKTLEAIGIEFGVTRERIRQIQNGALVILKRYLRQKKIGYLG